MDDVAALGSVLGIWAHPDDETFSSAGLMAAAAQNGQNVACITATRGEAGVYDPKRWPPDKLADIRQAESDAALEILGIKNHYWLDYKDGQCAQISDQAALEKLMPIIEQIKPDTIISFGPDGLTGHDDHIALSRWATLSCEKLSYRPRLLYSVISSDSYQNYLKIMDQKLNIFFNIDRPRMYNREACDLVFELNAELIDKKCQALQAMPSQTAGMLEQFSLDFVCQAFSEECFIEAKNYS